MLMKKSWDKAINEAIATVEDKFVLDGKYKLWLDNVFYDEVWNKWEAYDFIEFSNKLAHNYDYYDYEFYTYESVEEDLRYLADEESNDLLYELAMKFGNMDLYDMLDADYFKIDGYGKYYIINDNNIVDELYLDELFSIFFDDITSDKLFDDMGEEEVLDTSIGDVIEALYI